MLAKVDFRLSMKKKKVHDSGMQPEDDDFVLLDGDDFVAKSSDEAVLDEQAHFCEKGVENVCLLNSPPFKQGI